MVLFDNMDNERYEKEVKDYKYFKRPQKGDSKFFNYRLMQPEEVPEWVKSEVECTSHFF